MSDRLKTTEETKLTALYMAARRVLRMRDRKLLHVLPERDNVKEFGEAFDELDEKAKACERAR